MTLLNQCLVATMVFSAELVVRLASVLFLTRRPKLAVLSEFLKELERKAKRPQLPYGGAEF
jgi:hypothetical protein